MKGKVLGFDPASGTGAINGDDGKRYKFAAADNKSPAPLKANDTVDFEVADDAAKEIYVVKAGFSIPAGLGGTPGTEGTPAAGGDVVATILARPHAIWAAVVILGSAIAGYLGALSFLNAISGPFGTGLGLAALLAALLFFIPVIAAGQIFLEFTNHALTVKGRLVTAAAAIGGPVLIPFLAGLFAPSGYVEVMSIAGNGGGLIGFGITPGMVITIAGGVLIILTNMGIVKLPTKL